MCKLKPILISFLIVNSIVITLDLINIDTTNTIAIIFHILMTLTSMTLQFVPISVFLNVIAVIKLIILLNSGDIAMDDIYSKDYKLLIIPVGVSSGSSSSSSSSNKGGGGRSGGGGSGGKW